MLSDVLVGVAVTFKMPETISDLIVLLESIAEPPTAAPIMAVLERVQAYAGSPMGKSACFEFGRGFGRLEGALAASKIPYDAIPPQKWQAALGCLSRGDKNITKARAQALFPGLPITHATADALLLAVYCRRTYLGSFTSATKGQHGEEAKSEEQEAGAEKGQAGAQAVIDTGRSVLKAKGAASRRPAGARHGGHPQRAAR